MSQSDLTHLLAEAELDALAQTLETAWTTGVPIEPLSESRKLTFEQSYDVQRRWTRQRLAGGERVMGHKIGLTSEAIQTQLGVDQPDFGSLWASRYFPAAGGKAQAPAEIFLYPRIEAEIAFKLGSDLSARNGEVRWRDVLAATEAVAPALELVDSRIKDWRIAIADTVADNASYGGFTVGAWSPIAKHDDLSAIEMTLHHNGKVAAEGVGAAALGHPAKAVAWLATTLLALGQPLKAGDIVLSGALSRAVDVTSGDEITAQFSELAAIHMSII